MFLRSIAFLPFQSTIFKANTLQNFKIITRMAAGGPEKVCVEPCTGDTGTCTDKIKQIQSRFQKDEACPIWLRSTADKLVYLTTVGLALAGVGLSFYNILLRI
ncbi:unnamed protein product [Nezara viridula]|uniref:Uncharacterized protein n=1 Tax=Nezara viridula TaxID=85310 RepID=A0A9P0MN44_NEZVI|nr:unnamed protein product [Nezara viridula]